MAEAGRAIVDANRGATARTLARIVMLLGQNSDATAGKIVREQPNRRQPPQPCAGVVLETILGRLRCALARVARLGCGGQAEGFWLPSWRISHSECCPVT